MKRPSLYFYLNLALMLMGIIVSILWFREAHTTGRGFISRNLAPLAFGPPILSPFLMLMDRRARAKREKQKLPANGELLQRSSGSLR